MKLTKKLTVFLFLFFQFICHSQIVSTDSLLKKIPVKYFEMKRETFHLQLNKNTYLSNETIWFKGFVFNKTVHEILKETNNVHVDLLNAKGVKLDTKFCFANNGIFDGNFKLNEKSGSGIYYLQVYTNWSNNFTEDESAVIKFEIINTTEGKLDASLSEPIVDFYPESGNFIENTDNTIGIKITDCLENGLEITDATLYDENNIELTAFKTNNLGYGQIKINNAKNQTYKVKYNYNKKNYEKLIPKPLTDGITLTINNYTNEKNVFVTLKTNEKTLEKEKQNYFYFAINQNDQINYFKFKFEKLVQEITLPENLFYDGINIIRILDKNNNQICERIIYKKYDNKFDVNYTIVSKTKDSVKVAATFLNKVALGISVLPKDSKTVNSSQNIFNSLLISSYLKKEIFDKIDFFNDSSRKNAYVLDLILLCQKTKYDWNSMKNPPIENYSFNRGLTIKGTVNSKILGDEKIEMYSFVDGINEVTYLNNKNEFYFQNFIAVNSTNLNFVMRNEKHEKIDLIFYPQLLTEEKLFTKSFNYITENCNSLETTKLITESELFPVTKGAINLNDVTVKAGKKKIESENKSIRGNSNMRSYKITEEQNRMYTYLLTFLNSNGFNASSRFGKVILTSRIRTSFLEVNMPTVYLDDFELFDLDVLDNFSMKLIDEIFIDKYGTNINSKNGGGVIKIYTNQNYKARGNKEMSKNFTIKNGFEQTLTFTNPEYIDTSSDSFKNYGTISWFPNSERTEKAYLFTIPILGQKEVTIYTEGISETGKLISNTTVLNLE